MFAQNALTAFPVVAVLLGACSTLPSGPSVLVLPGTGKSFDQFRGDEADCRQFAFEQVGGVSPSRAANESGVRSGAIGTAVGAAAGAAVGGGRGAATGAGAGLLVGGVAGTGAAESAGYETQRRYDFGYVQCMYAKGHRVPVSGQLVSQPNQTTSQPPPPPPGAAPPAVVR
jgi:outer membrane lipoprotein SlyB